MNFLEISLNCFWNWLEGGDEECVLELLHSMEECTFVPSCSESTRTYELGVPDSEKPAKLDKLAIPTGAEGGVLKYAADPMCSLCKKLRFF